MGEKSERLKRKIGWREWVELPELGISKIKVKVDTGARNSALDVENVEELPRDRVRFDLVLQRHPARAGVRAARAGVRAAQGGVRSTRVEAPVARRGRVRSSSGHATTRLFVRTPVRIGPVEREVEVSLVDRERMGFRMLLGRSALRGLLVDASRRDLLARRRDRRPGGRPSSER